MIYLIVGLSAAFAPGVRSGADVNRLLNQPNWKLTLLLAAVIAALIRMASIMPGAW